MKTRVGQTYNCASNAADFKHWGFATKRLDGQYNFQADINDEIRVLLACQIHIVGVAEWHKPIKSEEG